MPKCMYCKQETSHEEALLEVRTLHVRDYSGERRIQALGSIISGSVCDKCAEAERMTILSPNRLLLVKVAAYLALALAGGILLFLFSDLPLKVPCACATLLGLLGAVSTIKKTMVRKKYLEAIPPKQALEEVRLRILKDGLPRKEGENNLTYICLTAILNEEPGTLVTQYGLLPPIAKEATERGREYYKFSTKKNNTGAILRSETGTPKYLRLHY